MNTNTIFLTLAGCAGMALAPLAHADYVVFQNGNYIEVDSCVMVPVGDGFEASWSDAGSTGSSASGICDDEHPEDPTGIDSGGGDLRGTLHDGAVSVPMIGAITLAPCPLGTKFQRDKTCLIIEEKKWLRSFNSF